MNRDAIKKEARETTNPCKNKLFCITAIDFLIEVKTAS
jgi:hypothetical protein